MSVWTWRAQSTVVTLRDCVGALSSIVGEGRNMCESEFFSWEVFVRSQQAKRAIIPREGGFTRERRATREYVSPAHFYVQTCVLMCHNRMFAGVVWALPSTCATQLSVYWSLDLLSLLGDHDAAEASERECQVLRLANVKVSFPLPSTLFWATSMHGLEFGWMHGSSKAFNIWPRNFKHPSTGSCSRRHSY